MRVSIPTSLLLCRKTNKHTVPIANLKYAKQSTYSYISRLSVCYEPLEQLPYDQSHHEKEGLELGKVDELSLIRLTEA
jgi:hypothetical protein